MNNIDVKIPSLIIRITSVWYRHFKVYSRNLISNAIPPFLETLIFIAAYGIGMSKYLTSMDGIDYMFFVASGMIVAPSMFTSAFECTYGTYIRMEFDRIYDGILSASINVKDLFLGEILFCATKGFFYTIAVLTVFLAFGLVKEITVLMVPFGGFITGMAFATFSLLVTSFVKTINHFNFYLTCVITPMFFFSGLIFPLTNLPKVFYYIAYSLPLAHCADIIRAFYLNKFNPLLLLNLLYLLVFIFITGYFAIIRLEKRLID